MITLPIPTNEPRFDLRAFMIVLTYGRTGQGNGWNAVLHWQDGRWCQPGTVEGKIYTRYFERTPAEAIEYVLAVAATFKLPLVPPEQFSLHYKGISEGAEDAPEGHQALLIEEAAKRGWNAPFKAEVQS